MTVKTRFAPSPTGKLHVGNARVALLNWLFARQAGGTFLLRMDDTDLERSTAAFAEGIREDLQWLGLTWDEEKEQSTRLQRYADVAEDLKASGRLYPCYETPEELELKRKVQLSQGKPPRYDRAALALTDAQRAENEASGQRPHWRFRLEDDAAVEWEDCTRGSVRMDASHMSDPVLVRADGSPVYTLASVIDDADMAITHVIRGEDHVSNTAVQIQLARALGATVPTYAHLPLLTNADGSALSKRLGSLSLQQLREQGLEAMAINSLLARLGSSQPVQPFASLDDITTVFRLEHFGRATPRFDPDELALLNARLLHQMPFTEVQQRLHAMDITVDEAFWQTVQPNLTRLEDIKEWQRICRQPLQPVIEDAGFTEAAAAALPGGALDEQTWSAWTAALKQQTGRKGKALFMPLRLALTGQAHGPELAGLLPLIGRERLLARLRGETA